MPIHDKNERSNCLIPKVLVGKTTVGRNIKVDGIGMGHDHRVLAKNSSISGLTISHVRHSLTCHSLTLA